MKIINVLACAVIALAIFPASARVFAQDPVKVAPHAFTERLHNDRVRVLEYSSKPGDKEAMHSHSDLVLYIIQGGKFKTTAPDGTSKEVEYKTGDVIWRGALNHSGENVGTTEIKGLLIELKPAGKKK